jgi:hypothetical protein
MRSYSATSANRECHAGIHPALTGFFDECRATLVHLVAYVGTFAMLGMVGLHLWNELPAAATEPAVMPAWSAASRSRPAFAVSALDPAEKSETYEILRHPQGGRKDVFHWGPPGEKPVAELEIYRPGGEFDRSEAVEAEIGARMGAEGVYELEAAGLVETKFGMVTLLRLTGHPEGTKACLGFIKRVGDLALQISGWSCQGSGIPARRAAIGCMLNRLTMLAAGNEPKLAELFARAELKRGNCVSATTSAASADWVIGAENPRLRGPL